MKITTSYSGVVRTFENVNPDSTLTYINTMMAATHLSDLKIVVERDKVINEVRSSK